MNISDMQKEFLSKLSYENLLYEVEKLNKSAWGSRVKRSEIESWTENFDGSALGDSEAEKKIALWLLSQMTFYTKYEIMALCRDVFSRYINIMIRKDYLEFSGELNELIEKKLETTRFLIIGNPSESSTYIAYLFRQANNLNTKLFSADTIDDAEYIVFLDDASFSGDQASSYIQDFLRESTYNSKRKYMLSLFATNDAKEIIFKETKTQVICSVNLDDRDRAFADESYLFSQQDFKMIKDITRYFCEYYGRKAVQYDSSMKEHPLGFNDGQFMISFEQNTPDNTMPIFWESNEEWKPIFKRNKKYDFGDELYEFDRRKYY